MIENADFKKEYRTDWENLNIGDYVFLDCDRSFCSIGNFGYKVVKITNGYIEIEDGKKYNKQHRRTEFNNPVSEIYLAYFQNITE